MHPPIKDQRTCFDRTDDPGIDASDGAWVKEHDDAQSHENEDLARQEFKDEADINYMLSKFGVTQPRNAPTYGEWDDSIDLQQALEATREARRGFNNLPKELRDKFNTLEDFMRAVDNGSLVIRAEEDKPPTSASTPADSPPAPTPEP